MKKILTIAVVIALTAISGIAFAEDLVQIPITKEALVGTWVGEWDRGYNAKGQRISGAVEIVFSNTDSFEYASSGQKFTGKIANLSTEKIELTDGKYRTDIYKMFKDAKGNLVLKGTYSDTSPGERSKTGEIVVKKKP